MTTFGADMSFFVQVVATVCLVWSLTVFVVELIGISSLFRRFSRRPEPPISPKLGHNAPHVTIIRPVKGLEPRLYDCIASSFRQEYPIERLSIRLCVDSTSDPSYPVLEKLVDDFPNFDVQILVETEDPVLYGSGSHAYTLGPNPKIRNISRAYREANDEDVIWMVDCNVWMAPSVLGRMVDKLMGYTIDGRSARPFKFVHQLPLVVDTVKFSRMTSAEETSATTHLLSSDRGEPASIESPGLLANGGGRLDEMFMATTHAKFYGAINEVGVAPCIVGKSNMFRKLHLDQATEQARRPGSAAHLPPTPGTDFFSWQICEDHLIGELLWNFKIPGYSSHGLVWGDLVLQPMAGMSVAAYAARRARWLRARKFTVPAATLVEPGVESFLCCAYFAFAITTLPWFHDRFGVPQTWAAVGAIWLGTVLCWMTADRLLFTRLHAGYTFAAEEHTPDFAMGMSRPGGVCQRPFVEWIAAWLGRESLALPIWIWAVVLGHTEDNSFPPQRRGLDSSGLQIGTIAFPKSVHDAIKLSLKRIEPPESSPDQVNRTSLLAPLINMRLNFLLLAGLAVASPLGTSVGGIAAQVLGLASWDIEGYAKSNPIGVTTGGKGGKKVYVQTPEELIAAAESTEPTIVYVKGEIALPRRLRVQSNKSIIGVGWNAVIKNNGFTITNQTNVIIRNLHISKIVNNDGLNIVNTTRVWVDHNEFSSEISVELGPDFYDGQVDINRASDWITVSWNYFHDHWKSSLVGNSDVLRDVDFGKLHITYHHNYWRNCGTRGPAGRFGHQHIYNNLYQDFLYQAIHSRSDNQVLVEANVFKGNTRTALNTYGLVIPEDSPNTCVCGDEELDGFANLGAKNDFGKAFVNITQKGDFYKSDYKFKLTPLWLVQPIVKLGVGVGKI
ncbi:ceramide glucosyltransferase [Paramyrothecium foliicola]|nr:ceramide glucosyltransferase [Paramyrothecium foliicola]